jgi:hypothetical protein
MRNRPCKTGGVNETNEALTLEPVLACAEQESLRKSYETP